MGRFAWTLGMLCCAALMPARAEVPGECAALFQDAGAIPGTQNCRTNAGNADFGLGTYYCNNPDIIAEYCGGTAAPKPWDPGKNNQCDVTTGPTQVGNPINAPLGIKVQTETDARDGTGHLALQRHYSSVAIDANPGNVLGPRWRHSFQISLTSADEDGTPVRRLNLPSGNSYRFLGEGNGVWKPDADVRERLQPVSQGGTQTGWDAIGSDDTRYRFDMDGKLVRISYRDGDVLTLRYASTGLLQDVTDVRSRRLQFGYSSGRLTVVKQPDGRQVKYAYTQQNLTRVQYQMTDGSSPTLATVKYVYGDSSDALLLTGIVDEAGQAYANWQYDSQGRAIASWHGGANSQIDRVSIDFGQQQSQVTDELGNVSTHSYAFALGRAKQTAVDQLCSQCGASQVSQRTYDANGYPDLLTDFKGVTTDEDYDARGLLVQRISAANDTEGRKRTVQTDWHPDFHVPTERRTYDASNALVSRSNWTYNTRGQPLTASRTDPASAITRTSTTTYCEQTDINAGRCPLLGLVTSVDGPRGDVTDKATYTYYATDASTCATSPTTCAYRKGDLWKVTNALGQVTEYLAYDGAGRVLSVKDANGVVTDYTYHPRGWLTASKVRGADDSSESDDRITTIDYWPTGLVKQVTQPDGAFTRFTYDAAHRLTDIADNAGNTIHYTLDNAGNRSKEDTKDASGTLKRTLSRVYNQLGQLATQATAQGDPTDFGYDANGNTKTVTDALGHATQNDYDPLNRLARTLQDVGGIAAETKFGYDALDNLTKVTDPKGLDTTYAYNGLGDLTKLTSSDTGSTTYTYDSAGNRATQTDARNIKTSYGYDALNRLTQVTYPTTSLNVSYTYDVSQTTCASGETYGVGRLTRMQDGSGSTDYCYDRFGELVRKVQTTNGKVFVVRYAYTKAGQLSRLTYPDGAVVDYVRNAQGQTTEVGVTPPGGARQVLLNQATYYPFGPVAGWTYGNGRPMQRVLDQDYRPLAVNDTRSDGLAVGFAFDPVGNLSALTAPGNTAPVVKLDYDPLGRLTAFKDGPTDTVIDSYTYDATGNRLSAQVNGAVQTYTYPASSHRLATTAKETRSYDAAGNTIAIDGASNEYAYDATGRMSQAKHGGVLAMEYRYNGRGEQVRRFLGTVNTHTLYDEGGHWLGDYDSKGKPVQQAIWMDDLPVGVLVGTALKYVQPDHLGSPRAVIDPARDVAIWTWDIKGEAFGNTKPNSDPDQDGTAFVFDMRFPGQRYDAASWFNQNYYRDYDTSTGRYAQSDPIGLSGGISTFAYSSSTPASRSDASGLISFGSSCGSAQRQNILNAVTEMANTIQGMAEKKKAGCYDGNCDFNKAAQVMRKVATASFNCNYPQINGLTVARPNYIFLSSHFASNPNDPIISSGTEASGAGCLMSSLYHEAMHLALWDELPNEDDVRRETRACFDCALNHGQGGGPLK
ncbi:RHS repeat-associated core domain-containing protein [Acidovorax sp. SUPP2539]|uniref:RHS repeat-associated core domain-containing protein n=1 Tax=Acidovorax sp. SUPP2539 TaxID=2920878 RepID=UPI0023DE28A3|nr:RHS repeat-associated core domain-containing protein [Acidovorax sp. SUPP2539]GKS92218.1 RHS repeat protein [Acidovorax sp. SUPP2539]